MFQTSQSTINRTKNRLVNWFYQLLKDSLSAQTLDWRLNNSAQFFETDYTFIVDGAEQQIELPRGNDVLNTTFFSGKKGHPSINILIFLSGKGHKILGLSPSCPGSVNDLQAIQKELTEWLAKNLTDQDHGMGDQGFNGFEKYFRNFATAGPHTPSGSLFSKVRIQVEQIIERFRNWRALKSQIRMKPTSEEVILNYHHKIWTIVAVFINDF